MRWARTLLHPLLMDICGRRILWMFFGVALVYGGYIFWSLKVTIGASGLSPSEGVPPLNGVVALLFSLPFQLVLLVGLAILIAGLTSKLVMGPFKRMEEWLGASKWKGPHHIFQVRVRDRWANFTRLLNELDQPVN